MKRYPKLSYATLYRPILYEILDNRFNSFAGIGRYSANDLLHMLCIFPLTPAFVICMDDEKFARLEMGLFDYVSQFTSETYLNRASSVPNTNNPFSFNNHFNTEFLSKWILVYKRSKAKVPIPLYNDLLNQGLLDENHVIGENFFLVKE